MKGNDFRVLSLGTVMKAGEATVMVTGYDLVPDQDSRPVPKYIVVPWPCGVIDDDSLKILDFDDYEVLFPGYETPEMDAVSNYYTTIDRWISVSKQSVSE